MALFPNLFGGQQAPQEPVLPRVPYQSNPMVTMAGMSLLGGRNLNDGLSNLAQSAPAGMAAKAGMQQFMLAQQERQKKQAEEDARRAQMNDMLKMWPNLSAEQRALAQLYPDQFAQQAFGSMGPQSAPTVETFYDEKTGLPVKKQWDPNSGQWVTQGGTKTPDGTSLYVDPTTGEVMFQSGEGVLPNGNQGLGRTTTNDIQKDIDDLEIQKSQVERIGQLYDPELLTIPGKVRGKWAEYADKLGVSGPGDRAYLDKQTRFVNNVEQVFNLYRKDITGAAAALAELDRLKQSVINTDQSPTQFQASLGEFARALQRGLDIKKRLLAQGIPLGSAQFSAAFEKEFLGGTAGNGPATTGAATTPGGVPDPLGIR